MMRMKSCPIKAKNVSPFSNHKRSGLSLIEVVVATALAGSLLAVAVVGISKHFRQLKMSKLKSEASQRLDQFLSVWSQHGLRLDEVEHAASQAKLSLSPTQVSNAKSAKSTAFQEVGFFVVVTKVGSPDLADSIVLRASVGHSGQFRWIQDLAWAEVVANE